MLMFADDTKLYAGYGINEEEEKTKDLQKTIYKLMSYIQQWQLTIFLSKMHVMHLGRGNPKVPYRLNPEIHINECSNIKDLGISYDNKLSFNTHIEKIVVKARMKTGVDIFKDIRNYSFMIQVKARDRKYS
ncbi:hypothetical protein ANCCEY_12558 [Ancylostoma ceylanicum]|uniref:Reverse transcriptase domain-containing protein n=1 Tax=Ancylostoma ceylanicum TaxID=53326 RepID=A0A0D6LEL9_9BILA|nr:hypothetical protein ANCCEY_12558 [Ancylostoma ceylanicum]